MRSKSWATLASLSIVTLPQAHAEPSADDLPIINMDTVVVTATQTEEDAFSTAKSVDKVDQEQLAVEQPESTAESVQYLTNVNTSQGPRQLSQQVNIRGLSGREVLQVLDNARQNFQNGHQGSFFLDPELLKEVEVLRGPGSSLWGSGAIGGVVNMTTIDPSDLLAEDQTIGAKVKGGLASADDLLYTSDSIYGRAGENNEYLLNFTYRNTNDITAGDHKNIPDSAFWDRSGMAKWVSNFTENQTLRLSYIAFDAYQNVPSDPRQNENDSENPLVDQNIYQQNWNATYEYENPENDWIDFTSTLYFNDTEVTDDCLGQCSEDLGGPERHDVTEYTTLGLNARNTSYLSWGALTFGGEVYQDRTTGTRNGEEREQFPDAIADVWATYVQVEVPFWESWTLTPGIRYDQFNNDPKQNTVLVGFPPAEVPISETSEGDVSTSVTLGWQATDWLGLYAIYDEAFRAPAIDELYPSGQHFPFNTFAPNPDLKPEKSHNKELSARFGWDELLCPDDELRMRVSAFRNDVDNLIQQQIQSVGGLRSITIYENVPKARLTGVEFDTTYRLEDWFTSLGYGYIRGKNLDPIKNDPDPFEQNQTDSLDDIPPERIILNLGRYFYEDTFMAGFRFTHAWSQDKVSQPQNCSPDSPVPANACPIDGYTTLDLYGTWQPSSPQLQNLQLDLTINN
ncbi:MAG: TonB-dependent hemoglobin/transferrin/lactoferrin family receptor, partial [Gammaproteobacteria bacterium]